MSLDGQLERLGALYDEKSDDELLVMYDDRDDLTEVAQQALADVMRGRGLKIRGAVSRGVLPRQDEGKWEDALAPGETLLYMFHDAFEAREAMRVVKEAEIPHRILDWHVVDPEQPVSPSGVDLGLVASREDARRVMVVLKEKLDLWPTGEDEGKTGEGDAFQMISMFDRAEALVAARALGEAGFSFLWQDGRDKGTNLPDGETVVIEVRGEHLAAATGTVERALAAMP